MQRFTIDEFRQRAVTSFAFLETRGFHRAPHLEETRSTYGTVVYVGKHVGFVFSLDVRDQCVDAEVVKVRDGQLRHNLDGGYSSDIFGHLVEHIGYRGNPAPGVESQPSQAAGYPLQLMIDGWANLLKQAGQSLLEDRPDSLPKGT